MRLLTVHMGRSDFIAILFSSILVFQASALNSLKAEFHETHRSHILIIFDT